MKKDNKDNEIFTPDFLVQDMINDLPSDLWEEGKTFIDPACGDGNLLVEILLRKIKKGHNPLEALSTLYGCDIVAGNVKKCRSRLLKMTSITLDSIKIVMKNIVWLDTKKFLNGSLDYDFSFNNQIKNEDAQNWLNFLCGKTNIEPEIESEIPENDMYDLFLREK